MNIRWKRILFSYLLFLVCSCIFVNASSQAVSLQEYIDQGFKNNIVLQQKKVSLDKAMYALQTAQSMFLPTVALQGNYQTSSGGRSIDIPVGDLLNPVYTTLNQLTSGNNFPQVKNVSQNFLPTNFYDARLHTTVPIINNDLRYNKKIQEQQVNLQQYEIEIYQRELVKNIKTAYFNYITALEAVKIYKSSALLAEEGKRVNESLLQNGKGLPAYVLRSISEIESIKAETNNAQMQANNARAFFNFLLNKSASDSINASFNGQDSLPNVLKLMEDQPGINNREELKSLNQSVQLNQTVNEMNRNYWVPKLNGFVDVGSQAEDWKFNSTSRFYFAGLQMEMPIFSGNRNKIKLKQSQADIKQAQLSLELATSQLTLAGYTARNNLLSIYQTYQSSLKQLDAASSYQRLIDKGYKAGTNTFIETVDARNQFTAASLSLTINLYKVFIAAAELERQTASYTIH